jgi:hypothetical protein
MKKKCSSCGKEKDDKSFQLDFSYKDNRRVKCKSCEYQEKKSREQAKRNDPIHQFLLNAY